MSINYGFGPLCQMLYFEFVEGPRAGEALTIPLPEPGESPLLIGRSQDCNIWVADGQISRRHTEIFAGPDRRPLLRDKGSVNGTRVNGQIISRTTPIAMHPGDRIRVGLTEMIYIGMTSSPPPQGTAVPAPPHPPAGPMPAQAVPPTDDFKAQPGGLSGRV